MKTLRPHPRLLGRGAETQKDRETRNLLNSLPHLIFVSRPPPNVWLMEQTTGRESESARRIEADAGSVRWMFSFKGTQLAYLLYAKLAITANRGRYF